MTDTASPSQSAAKAELALIRLNAAPANREAAIRAAGQILVDNGAVEPPYVESMLGREKQADTWLGDGVAIPHGMVQDKHYVLADKVSVLQVPQGVEWSNGEKAYLIFGIAARGDGHLAVLRRLTRLLQHPEDLKNLFTTQNPADIARALTDAAGADAAAGQNAPRVKDLAVTRAWKMDYPNGLHARPSSAWIDAAKQAGIALQARCGNQVSDIKSLVSLLQLGAKCGDEIIFSAAAGPDAEARLDGFLQVVKGLSAGEIEQARAAAEQQKQAVANSWTPPSQAAPIVGVPAAPGLAIGTVHRLLAAQTEVEDKPMPAEQGAQMLQEALAKTRADMQATIDDVSRRVGAHEAGIFKAQAELLDDDGLIGKSCALMLDGHGPAWAWAQAIEGTAKSLAAMNNPLLAGRAADLRDAGRKVLENLDPKYAAGSMSHLPKGGNVILVAEELSPSQTAAINTDEISGIATVAGGPTSHMAILSRTMGLPAVVAAGQPLEAAKSGDKAIINGDSGAVWLNPSDTDIEAAKAEIIRRADVAKKQAQERRLPAKTPDGHKVVIAANVNNPGQVAFALDEGAEAVGLMRTEFLFLEAASAPDEESQFKTYRGMLDALGGRPLIVRTLDIGGDKQVAYLNLPHEQNPFLGVRGARLTLQKPELMYPQLKALYRAAKEGGDISIMFPMIMSVDEVIKLKAIAEDVRAGLNAPKVPLGIMVEVPSAAICADKLAKHVDFFSIGTNDLTQYTLAVDRENPVLAAQSDGVHPAVLRMIQRTVEGAKLYNRFVGVCGGIAADPFAAVLLTGLGVNELSMTPRDIPPVKARLRATSFREMQELARQACNMETIKQVRALDKGMPQSAETKAEPETGAAGTAAPQAAVPQPAGAL